MHSIGVYQFLVSFLYGVYLTDTPLDGCVLCYSLYCGHTVMVYLLHVGRRYHSCVVNLLKSFLDMSSVIGIILNNQGFVVIILFQFLYHLLSCLNIEAVIRSIEFQDAVLFGFYLNIVFVDRKIERCLQQSVFPWFVQFELIVELTLFGHEIDDD